jgi:hypothetical protein
VLGPARDLPALLFNDGQRASAPLLLRPTELPSSVLDRFEDNLRSSNGARLLPSRSRTRPPARLATMLIDSCRRPIGSGGYRDRGGGCRNGISPHRGISQSGYLARNSHASDSGEIGHFAEQESRMSLSFQIVLAISLVAFIGLWRRAQAKQKQRSWDEIVAALRANDWGLDEVSERYLYRGGIKATPDDLWKRIDGARGLWAMYCNAPLLVQLADYAAEHGAEPDEALLEGLRSDAFQIRLSILMALAKYGLSRSTVGASSNAFQATTLYSEMLARLTALFQESAGQLFPQYLAAM